MGKRKGFLWENYTRGNIILSSDLRKKTELFFAPFLPGFQWYSHGIQTVYRPRFFAADFPGSP